MTTLVTQYPAWWILPAGMLGLLYAWLLYGNPTTTWSKTVNRFLALLRWTLVSSIAILLIGIFIKNTVLRYEKPIIAFGIDNSLSVAMVYDTAKLQAMRTQISRWSEELTQKGFDVKIYTLEAPLQTDSLSNLSFKATATDLHQLLKTMQLSHDNKYLSQMILLSDGIFNQGIAPDYWVSSVPIHTIGIGDTVPKNDLQLKSVYANKITYLGNRFPIVAEIINTGLVGKKTIVLLKKDQQILDKKEIIFDTNNQVKNIEFLANAPQVGTFGYTIEVQGVAGEYSLQNNRRTIYVEVLDAKEKILIVAGAPHPDIKAIRSALERNQNYEITIYIPTLAEINQQQKINFDDKYDLIIFYQVPNLRNIGTDVWQKLKEKKIPTWYILGNQSNVQLFSSTNDIVKIIANNIQKDRTTAIFNESFDRFLYENDFKAVIHRFPPLSVPFGEYQLANNSISLLYQRIGSINTQKPLLVVGEAKDVKIGALLGEGLWQWRLQNFQMKQNHEAFDQLLLKTVQYLSAKEDKRKFRVSIASSEYIVGEDVIFETEIYNDIYEQITGKKVTLTLNTSNQSVEYSFVNTTPSFKFPVKGLAQGIYQYKAIVNLNNQNQEVTGKFVVQDIEIETANTTAQWFVLRGIAETSGGSFTSYQQAQMLIDQIGSRKTPDKIHPEEQQTDIMQWNLLFWIIIGLITTEWVVRKYKGSY